MTSPKNNYPELKSCPACGNEVDLIEKGNDYSKKRSVLIKCPKCRLQVTNGAIRFNMEWLVNVSTEQWNNQPRIDQLEKQLSDIDTILMGYELELDQLELIKKILEVKI